MTIVKTLMYIAAFVFILWGGILICAALSPDQELQTLITRIISGVIFFLVGFGLLWFARKPIQTSGVTNPPVTDNLQQSLGQTPQTLPTKKLSPLLLISLSLVALGILSFCILWTRSIWISFSPETDSYHIYFYRDASIEEMMEGCNVDQSYTGPESWMNPVAGSDIVLETAYSRMSPAVDAFYAYRLFLQIQPELIVSGQELQIPGQDVLPFIIETRAPLNYCSSNLVGSIKFLSVSNNTMNAQLELSGTIHGLDWSIDQGGEFNIAPLPGKGLP